MREGSPPDGDDRPSSDAPSSGEGSAASPAEGRAPTASSEDGGPVGAPDGATSSAPPAPGEPAGAREEAPREPASPPSSAGVPTGAPAGAKGEAAGDVPRSPALARVGWKRAALQLALVLSLGLIGGSGFMVACNTKTSAVRNTNVGSRYGTVEALVNHGTYAITNTQYVRTIDKVKYKDDFISSKPPTLPTVTAGIYWLYREVTGYDIRTDEKKVVRFCNWMMGAVLHVIMLLFWLRLMLFISPRPEVVLLAVGTMAYGFLAAGYAIELNNHSVAACLCTVGFFFAFRIRNNLDARPWHYSICGFIFGFLPAVDVPSGAVSIGVFLYLLTHDWKMTLTRGLPFALPGPIVAMYLNTLITGSILPVQLQPDLKNYPGSYWMNPKGVDALREPKYIYGFNVLVGHHGIFTMTPSLLLGLLFLWRNGRRIVKDLRDKTTSDIPFKAETILVGSLALLLCTYYIARTHNYGGNCVGFRWAISWTPLLFVAVAFYLATTKLRVPHVLFVTFATGVTMFHIWECYWTPWHVGSWERLVSMVLKHTVGW